MRPHFTKVKRRVCGWYVTLQAMVTWPDFGLGFHVMPLRDADDDIWGITVQVAVVEFALWVERTSERERCAIATSKLSKALGRSQGIVENP